MQDLENILAEFQKFVSPDFCYNLAKKVGFIQRSTSQLQGYEFAQGLKSMVKGNGKFVNMVIANGEHGENFIWQFVQILMKFFL